MMTEKGQTVSVGSTGGLGASAPTVPDKAAIERQMRYLCEADARLSEIKIRTRGAKHFMRRRDRDHAQHELLQVINEARRLHLHLEAWDSYVIPSPNNGDDQRATSAESKLT
jgi:hypothetical protein